MGWRTVVVTGCAKLDYKMDYLVVRKSVGTNKVHLSEVELLLIESTAVSLTTLLLSKLNDFKIKVIFCDDNHNPDAELLPYYGSHDTSIKVKKQISWSESLKKTVWTEIVTEKIKKQRDFLIDRDLQDQAELLDSYLQDIKYADESNREGHAAKVYFNALFGMNFSRSEECAINGALNYGYGVLLSIFNREIVANGYLTQLGLFHDNMFNQFNLASDLMEPYRILVDRKVCELSPTCFEHDEKMELIRLFGDSISIDGKKCTITNAIKIYCKSVFDALNEKNCDYIKFYSNELQIHESNCFF